MCSHGVCPAKEMQKDMQCSLFGPDDKDNGTVDKTDTSKSPPLRRKSVDNDLSFVMRIFCFAFSFSYDVASNVDLDTNTGADVLAKVKEADGPFDPDKFGLSFHPGCSNTLAIFKPSVLFSNCGH